MALTDNLEAYWTLDETSGTRADSTANDRDLTDNNTVGYNTGVISNGASLAGASSEYLSAADAAWNSPSSAFTFAGWVRYPTAGQRADVFAKGPAAFGTGLLLVCERDFVSSRIEFFANFGGNILDATATVDGATSAATWFHLAVVFDGAGSGNSGRCKIYVNGAAQSPSYGGTFGTSLADTGSDLQLGAWATQSLYGDIRLDEVGWWSRALSGSEVAQLYNSGAGLSYPFTASTYSATAALTTAPATTAIAATSTPPTFSGTSAATTGAATTSASATATPPTFSATAGLSAAPATASAAATSAPPTFTATAAVSTGAATSSSAATATPPTFTASAALSAAAAVLAASCTTNSTAVAPAGGLRAREGYALRVREGYALKAREGYALRVREG